MESREASRQAAPAAQAIESQSVYRVQRGDTLYSIAFRYGLDFRKVAAANGIAAPYTIYSGQLLKLSETPLAVSSKSPAQKPVKRERPRGTSGSVPPPATAPAPAQGGAQAGNPPSSTSTAIYSGGPVRAWRWPTRGTVTRGYSGSVHKGIDIGGARGDSVVAVAPGKVVYAGTGIVGLGELLIVKHNDVYLSAYAHNERLLVSEGDVVSAGQRIADKGSSGTDTVKLHFEIRKAGKPVDPVRLLPRR